MPPSNVKLEYCSFKHSAFLSNATSVSSLHQFLSFPLMSNLLPVQNRAKTCHLQHANLLSILLCLKKSNTIGWSQSCLLCVRNMKSPCCIIQHHQIPQFRCQVFIFNNLFQLFTPNVSAPRYFKKKKETTLFFLLNPQDALPLIFLSLCTLKSQKVFASLFCTTFSGTLFTILLYQPSRSSIGDDQ